MSDLSATYVRIGTSSLEVHPLNLGGNVFGWTADEKASFDVLDAYVAGGGNFVDTADTYDGSRFGVPGGMPSEEILGRWMESRGNRSQMVIATKVGMGVDSGGLAPDRIRSHAEQSLRRLRTDHIDLYYAHKDDPGTPLEEALGAFDALVREGKVRYIAASNYSASRLTSALEVSSREGSASYVALQPHYNLMERAYEDSLASVVARHGLSTLPYFALASGFLTGKYEPGVAPTGARSGGVGRWVDDPRAPRVLSALRSVASAHGVAVASVALAWLVAQPTVAAPIASARDASQVDALLAGVELTLDPAELAELAAASA